MAQPAHYSLFYEYKKREPVAFFEARRCGGMVWTACGAVGTYGEEKLKTYKQDRRALAYHEKLKQETAAAGFELVRDYDYDPETFDFDRLETEIQDAARQCYLETLRANKGLNIVSFALFSDHGAMTLSSVADSLETRPKAIETMKAAEIDDAERQAKFCIFDWTVRGKNTFLDVPYRMLLSRHRDIPFHTPIDPSHFEPRAFEACVRALEALKDDGLFETSPAKQEFLLLFEIADDDQIEGMAERLNSPKTAQAFVDWLGEENFVSIEA